VPAELRDLAARASAILQTMVSEETAEFARDGASLAPMTMFAAPLKTALLKTPRLSKVGARNNEKDQARIQHLHDTSVELGAVCETQKVMRGGLEKRFDVLVEAIADVLRRVKNIEEQPLPLPLFGQPRAILRSPFSMPRRSWAMRACSLRRPAFRLRWWRRPPQRGNIP
jgi:hypothetical protein